GVTSGGGRAFRARSFPPPLSPPLHGGEGPRRRVSRRCLAPLSPPNPPDVTPAKAEAYGPVQPRSNPRRRMALPRKRGAVGQRPASIRPAAPDVTPAKAGAYGAFG